MAPTLAANAINTGSPFTTTYSGSGVDVLPTIDAGVIWSYLTDVQFPLLLLAAAWVVGDPALGP